MLLSSHASMFPIFNTLRSPTYYYLGLINNLTIKKSIVRFGDIGHKGALNSRIVNVLQVYYVIVRHLRIQYSEVRDSCEV
jgi:hypothetical protein